MSFAGIQHLTEPSSKSFLEGLGPLPTGRRVAPVVDPSSGYDSSPSLHLRSCDFLGKSLRSALRREQVRQFRFNENRTRRDLCKEP